MCNCALCIVHVAGRGEEAPRWWSPQPEGGGTELWSWWVSFLGWVMYTLCKCACLRSVQFAGFICWSCLPLIGATTRRPLGEVSPGSDPYWASSTTQVWPVNVFFFFQFWILNRTFSALLIKWIKLLQFKNDFLSVRYSAITSTWEVDECQVVFFCIEICTLYKLCT